VGVIRSIRRMAPGCKVEVLTPDFRGEEMPLARVIAERPDVFNHNVETVPRAGKRRGGGEGSSGFLLGHLRYSSRLLSTR